MTELLDLIERYYDAVPRSASSPEAIGPLTLFVNRGPGWSYYARPALGAQSISPEDLSRVRERQRALGVPEAFEWVAETTPAFTRAAAAAGLQIHEHPLLVLDPSAREPAKPEPGVLLRIVDLEDDLALLGAVAAVAFDSPGTAVGTAGTSELAAAVELRTQEQVEFERERLRAGLTSMAAAYFEGRPVAVGSHQPVGRVTEIVGVGTLPAHRRHGIAGALTARLIEDALERGVETVFLSADDAAVARVYERLGFRRVGTACVAEAAGR